MISLCVQPLRNLELLMKRKMYFKLRLTGLFVNALVTPTKYVGKKQPSLESNEYIKIPVDFRLEVLKHFLKVYVPLIAFVP